MATDGNRQAIETLESRLAEVRAQLDDVRRPLEADVQALERSIALLRGVASGESSSTEEHKVSTWADLGPQEAVLDLLGRHPAGTALKPSEMSKELIRLGCQPKTPRNYPTVLRTACKVLVKKGKLTATDVDGRAAFTLQNGEAQ